MIRMVALACGLLCGVGLTLSTLFQPSLLHDFLSPGDGWDPTLGLGLLSALIVAAIGFAVAGRSVRPFLGGETQKPATRSGMKVIIGGIVFGLGWGLSGYFPLAAIVALGFFAPGAATFLVSVLGGMILHDVIANRNRPQRARPRSRG